MNLSENEIIDENESIEPEVEVVEEYYDLLTSDTAEARRLKKMQDDFIANSKKVKIADYAYVYEKIK